MMDEIHNTMVVGMHETLTKPESLAAAAEAFDASSGSVEVKLAAAFTAAAALHLRDVKQLELPEGWQEGTVKELRSLAAAVGVYAPYSFNKDELVCALELEAAKRQRLSTLQEVDAAAVGDGLGEVPVAGPRVSVSGAQRSLGFSK